MKLFINLVLGWSFFTLGGVEEKHLDLTNLSPIDRQLVKALEQTHSLRSRLVVIEKCKNFLPKTLEPAFLRDVQSLQNSLCTLEASRYAIEADQSKIKQEDITKKLVTLNADLNKAQSHIDSLEKRVNGFRSRL